MNAARLDYIKTASDRVRRNELPEVVERFEALVEEHKNDPILDLYKLLITACREVKKSKMSAAALNDVHRNMTS